MALLIRLAILFFIYLKYNRHNILLYEFLERKTKRCQDLRRQAANDVGGHLLLVKDNEDLVQQVVNDEREFLSLVKDADNLLHLLVKDNKDLVHQVFNDELGHPQ